MNGQMSARERNLVMIVGAIALVFITYFVGDYFLKSRARLLAERDTKARQLKTMEALSAEKPLWEQRDAWLSAKQPKLSNEDTAGVQLLDQIKELAKKHGVMIENPVIGRPNRRPEYTGIGVDIETKSPWSGLIAFLTELQTPDQFIVLELANLKKDAADQTQMRGKFKIARWYAPK
jgi:type II secretory pathway component PulM